MKKSKGKTTAIVLAVMAAVLVLAALAHRVDIPGSWLRRSDAERIQGEWRIVSVTYGGPEDTAGGRFVFAGETFTISHTLDRQEGTFSLDPSRRPPWIDLTAEGRLVPGIYELRGDTLRMCWNDDDRPNAFEAIEGSGDVLILLERKHRD